jgi:hypothetical protein
VSIEATVLTRRRDGERPPTSLVLVPLAPRDDNKVGRAEVFEGTLLYSARSRWKSG